MNKQKPQGLIPRIRAAWKTFIHGTGSSYWLGDSATSWGYSTSYGTTLDYKTEAGELSQNAIIMACIQSIMRAFPEAPMKVMKQGPNGSEPMPAHKLTKLLKKPNKHFSGRLLWQATVYSLNLDGNAYWLKVRGGGGQVVELWYEPHFTIRVRWPASGEEFISHYEVTRGGKWYRVEVEDVVHFRFGIDPHNIRKGISPLASALREVFTDNQAARYSAVMLKNLGIPGVIISAKEGTLMSDPDKVKYEFMAKFSGDHVGEPLVIEDNVSVSILSFSPEQMNLVGLRRIPEERIPALLSWPAVVAGLGAGLDHSTYNNMDEARQQAYEQNIIPTQMVLSDDLGTQLLPDFGDPETEVVVFDLSQVRVLQDDQAKLYERLSKGYDSGWIKRSEARTATGWEVSPEDEVYKVAQPALGSGAATGAQGAGEGKTVDDEKAGDRWLRYRLATQAGLLTVNEGRGGIDFPAIEGGDVFLVKPGSASESLDDAVGAPLMLPSGEPTKGYKAFTKADVDKRRLALERALERDVMAILAKDYEAMAKRVEAA